MPSIENDVNKATIVVCSFNRAESLKVTLQSLAMLEIPNGLDTELIVVDNNSTDHTKSAVEQWHDHPLSLRYVFEPTQGLSHARNRALREATGEIILYTDDDVKPGKSWLRTMIGVFREDSKIGVVGGRILPAWENASPPKWLTSELFPYLALLDYGDQRLELLEKDVWGANIGFRTEPLRLSGGFPTNVGRMGRKLYIGEETKALEAVRAQGFKVIYEPTSEVLHRMQSDRLDRSYFIKWAWDNGEIDAQPNELENARKLFGVPLYRFRILFRQLAEILKAPKGHKFQKSLVAIRQASKIWHSFSIIGRRAIP